MPDTDYELLAECYDAGRALPLDALHLWEEALARLVDDHSSVLDVGAGTGLWAAAFVRWFGVSVVGIEPSHAMVRRAVAQRADHNIAFVLGRAEQLPVRDDAFGTAWLSTVVHHIGDLPACAQELRRVLVPDGAVLIRGAFADRADEIPWLRWFPEAREPARRRWPSVACVAAAFTAAGFGVEGLHRIRQFDAPTFAAYIDKVEVRADSTLAEIPDDAFERGVAAMRRADANGEHVGPVVTGLDLLVLR